MLNQDPIRDSYLTFVIAGSLSYVQIRCKVCENVVSQQHRIADIEMSTLIEHQENLSHSHHCDKGFLIQVCNRPEDSMEIVPGRWKRTIKEFERNMNSRELFTKSLRSVFSIPVNTLTQRVRGSFEKVQKNFAT